MKMAVTFVRNVYVTVVSYSICLTTMSQLNGLWVMDFFQSCNVAYFVYLYSKCL